MLMPSYVTSCNSLSCNSRVHSMAACEWSFCLPVSITAPLLPSKLSVHTAGLNSLRISWRVPQQPEHSRGASLEGARYVLKYRQGQRKFQAVTTAGNLGPSGNVTISGLALGKMYTFKLAVHTTSRLRFVILSHPMMLTSDISMLLLVGCRVLFAKFWLNRWHHYRKPCQQTAMECSNTVYKRTWINFTNILCFLNWLLGKSVSFVGPKYRKSAFSANVLQLRAAYAIRWCTPYSV